MTRVKVCGIRSFDNALMVAQAGVDMLGFNFYPKTPRYIKPSVAQEVVRQLRDELGDSCPVIVGLFVNEALETIRTIYEKVELDCVQLSGDESVDFVRTLNFRSFKALRPVDKQRALDDVKAFEDTLDTDDRFPSLIVDAFNPKLYGGTGETASVDVALAVKERVPRMMLAGGLNPENVAERVRIIQPWGVDVASGVEDGIPGFKDEFKVKAFVEAVRSTTE